MKFLTALNYSVLIGAIAALILQYAGVDKRSEKIASAIVIAVQMASFSINPSLLKLFENDD